MASRISKIGCSERKEKKEETHTHTPHLRCVCVQRGTRDLCLDDIVRSVQRVGGGKRCRLIDILIRKALQ